MLDDRMLPADCDDVAQLRAQVATLTAELAQRDATGWIRIDFDHYKDFGEMPAALVLYSYLINRQGTNPGLWYGEQAMATDLGWSARTVRRWVGVLRAHSLIVRVDHPANSKTAYTRVFAVSEREYVKNKYDKLAHKLESDLDAFRAARAK